MKLDLGRNNLTGAIPPQLDILTSLTELWLYANSLTGAIPPELGNLTNLTGLYLHANRLTGAIPPQLGNLASLTHLYLYSNSLEGPIPGSFLQLQRLRFFDADNRNCVPATEAFQAWLEGLDGHSATLCNNADRAALMALYHSAGGTSWTRSDNWGTDAPLGEWFGVTTDSLGRVTRLLLDGNNLIGSVPPGLGNLTDLQDLYLSENQLTGSVPGDFTLLCNLRTLFLDRNRLLRLPAAPHPCFGRELTVLHLHDNRFAGAFPPWLASLTRLVWVTLGGPGRTCVPASEGFRGWVRDLHERGVLDKADTPAWCGEGFWFTWRFEQTTTGRGWTGRRPFAAHRVSGEPMLLRIFMGMDGNNLGSWAIKSPRMQVRFQSHRNPDPSAPRVDVPADAIHLWATRDEAFRLDASYRQSINILIPGSLVKRGRTPRILIDFDPDGTFREIAGNRMPALDHDEIFAPLEWVRRIDFGQTYEILSGHDANPRAGWPTQDMPPAKVYLMPVVKSLSDDRGMIQTVGDLVRTGPSHPFFWETQNLLPIKDLYVRGGRSLSLGYHPTNDNRWAVVTALELALQFRTFDDEFDHIVGLMPEGAGIANHFGGRFSVVGYNNGSMDNNSLAHELGHNMSLLHAPCDVTWWKDYSYPWSDGSIGGRSVRGIDFGIRSLGLNRVREWGGKYISSVDRPVLLDPDETGFIVEGDTPDLMGYCRRGFYPRRWISAYHFDKALNHRQPATSNPARVAGTAPTTALLLAGGRKPDGAMFLWPSFVGEARPRLPQDDGPYRIRGQDKQGRELFSLDFDMAELPDGEGASSFVFAVPVRQEWANALTRITLTGPDGSVTLDGDSGLAAVLLRDSTGEVRGILHDWADSALTPGGIAEALGDPSIDAWDVQISRGIPDASYWRRR